MRAFFDAAWRTAVVLGGAVLAGVVLGDGSTAGIVAAILILAFAGALADRWWAPLVLVGLVLAIGGVEFLFDPDSWDDGREMTNGGVWLLLVVFSVIAGGCIAAGVATRRALRRASAASRPRTTRTGSR